VKSRLASAFETSFACPRCGAYAHQQWHELRAVPSEPLRKPPPFFSGTQQTVVPKLDIVRVAIEPENAVAHRVQSLRVSSCHACGTASVWAGTTLVHPAVTGRRHAPHADLSEDVRLDFIEADEIHQKSPRGAAALLRVAIEKLCQEITGDKRSGLDAQIERLVARGMDEKVQKMLDVVRVIGNDAVHPGVLDLRDDVDTVQQLFLLVTEIAEEMIAKPKRLDAMFDSLPQAKRDGIERRNKRAKQGTQTKTENDKKDDAQTKDT
jgi:hypothetical protein